MSCFDGEDGSCSVQEVRIRDEVCSSQVRADTNVLDRSCNGGHGCNVSEDWVKVEGAAGEGSVAIVRQCLVKTVNTQYQFLCSGRHVVVPLTPRHGQFRGPGYSGNFG